MNIASLKNERTTFIRWSNEEAAAVAFEFVPLRLAFPKMTHAEVLNRAQSFLPEDRRHHIANPRIAYGLVERLNGIWQEFARKDPTRAQQLINGVEKSTWGDAATPGQKWDRGGDKKDDQMSGRVQPQVVEEQPAAPTPAAPVVLGPFEQAMQVMVERAVEASLGKIIAQQQALIEKQNEMIMSLLVAQHDSLMCYWDEDFKRTRTIAPEWVGDLKGFPAQLEQVRVRRKRVLIVTTGSGNIRNNIESKFNGVDFTFAEGNTQKPFNAGDFYDLVICNATNRPQVRDKLVEMHGRHKVIFIDGGTHMMVDAIRKRLGI